MTGNTRILPGVEISPSLGELTRERSPGAWWSSVLIAEGLAVLDELEPLSLLYPIFVEAIRSRHAVSVLGGPQLYRKVAAICDAARRRWEPAVEQFEAALRQADELPHKLEQPEVRRWYAKILVDRDDTGDRERATRLLEEAIERYRAIGMPRHVEMAETLLAA